MRDDGLRLLCCGLLLPVLLGACGSQEVAGGAGGAGHAPQLPAARDEGVETPAAPCAVDEDGCAPGAEQDTQAPASTEVAAVGPTRGEEPSAAPGGDEALEAAPTVPDSDAYVAVHPDSEAHAASVVRESALPPPASEDAEDSDAWARVHVTESEPVSPPAPSDRARWNGRGSP